MVTAIGGTASATTTIKNFDAITSRHDGIEGTSYANASAYGSSNSKPAGSGTGGTGYASVVINNYTAGVISSHREGIDGSSYAKAYGYGFTGTGGLASAITQITNFAAIMSHGDGIDGFAKANASGYGSNTPGGKGIGGTAIAGVTITNNTGANITSSREGGIDGYSYARANGNAFAAQGGHATAVTTVVNHATIISQEDGIYGGANAYANAYGSPADKSGTVAAGSGIGGLAIAQVFITNTGAVSVKDKGEAIDGQSYAGANGTGYLGKGGTASATTSITNSGTLFSYKGDGIDGFATALANGYGIGTHDKLSVSTGGHATATVVISNTGDIASTGYETRRRGGNSTAPGTGIVGGSYAQADAGYVDFNFGHREFGPEPDRAPTAYYAHGGTAIASTTISNAGYIHAVVGTEQERNHTEYFGGNGIAGYATALADAVASGWPQEERRRDRRDHDDVPPKGTAIGGYAYALVTITNLANADGQGIVAKDSNGIIGGSYASASAFGFYATGGTASAVTRITNSAPILSDDGIDGFASAFALGIGSQYFDPGQGTGGTAVARVQITNSGDINATFGFGNNNGGKGIYGASYATAYASGNIAVGGSATATTLIDNTGTNGKITSSDDGIRGNAVAIASALSMYGGIHSSAVGGYAYAGVDINNSHYISSGGDGIVGSSKAFALGVLCTGDCDPNLQTGSDWDDVVNASNGTGGTAIANTWITNSGNILTYNSHSEGIDGRSGAYAYGSGAGGTATAQTYILNQAGVVIKTTDHKSPGIKAQSYAGAEGGLVGGTASATTIVNSYGSLIVTQDWKSDGINASSEAKASADHPGGTGGTAVAHTYVNNTAAIFTNEGHSNGIKAKSWAGAEGYNGYASAYTRVQNFILGPDSNSGSITTKEDNSAGIDAFSGAKGGSAFYGTANAHALIVNDAKITTSGDDSEGLKAVAFAWGYDATATASVKNFGKIVTSGDDSAGIEVRAEATGDANAYAFVRNYNSITTKEHNSPGIDAKSKAYGLLNAYAKTSVYNTGDITTSDHKSPGISAVADATDLNSTSKARVFVTNRGNILTTGSRSVGVYMGVKNATNGYMRLNNYGSISANGEEYTAVKATGASTVINNAASRYQRQRAVVSFCRHFHELRHLEDAGQ